MGWRFSDALYQRPFLMTGRRGHYVMAGERPPSTILPLASKEFVDGPPPTFAGACVAGHDVVAPPASQREGPLVLDREQPVSMSLRGA